ncbi:MAG: outer membrane beta-barrel protein [Gemmatimonadetes bacterium]|nr:outer membrane beta-barrel protein [Gemmatimonadota bacterium]NIO31210.1 outer membrane beta-barrel protein [Gemmatimonadota bacterium]
MNRAMFATAVVLCLGFAGISDAQAQGLTLGAQGGYNYAQLSDVPTGLDEVGDKGSFVVGAFLDVQFHETLFLGLEANYVEYKNEWTLLTETGVIKQAYIQAPIYLGARLMTGMLQPVVYGGATANFETTCKIDPDNLSAEDCSTEGIDTESVTWNAVFGGGINIALPMIVLSADLRYNLGLSKAAEGEDSKWNSWMGLVGIGIRLGG